MANSWWHKYARPGYAPCVKNKMSFPTHSTYLTIKHMLVHQYCMYSLHSGLQWLLSFVHWSPCRSGRAWPIHSTIPALYLAFTQECAPIFPSNWWAYQRAWTLEAQGKTLPNPHLFSHSIYSMFSSHSMMEGLLATSSTQLTVTLPFSWPPPRWMFCGFSSFFKFSSRMGKLFQRWRGVCLILQTTSACLQVIHGHAFMFCRLSTLCATLDGPFLVG